jgi:hypothetical protein
MKGILRKKNKEWVVTDFASQIYTLHPHDIKMNEFYFKELLKEGKSVEFEIVSKYAKISISNQYSLESYILDEEIEIAAANLANPNLCKTQNWIEGAKWFKERLSSVTK